LEFGFVIMSVRRLVLVLFLAAIAVPAAFDLTALTPDAQASSGSTPGGNPKSWSEPIEPFHIAGPIYYVGTRGLGVFLITTPAGNILLGGAIPGTAPLIEASMRKLGFKPEELRIILSNHAHFDHAGTFADLKELSGAQLAVMQQDVELLQSGGKTDYLYAKNEKFHFPPVTADRVLHDGDTLTLGGVSLTAHRTSGHTPGCTTWTTTVPEAGRSYAVVFADCKNINPGTRLLKNPSYPGIADDYRHTFSVLESLHPDIFLSYHPEAYDPEGKRDRAMKEGVQAWVDPNGYQSYVADGKAKLEEQMSKEK
jgi:metallo-beta-lactamase class B